MSKYELILTSEMLKGERVLGLKRTNDLPRLSWQLYWPLVRIVAPRYNEGFARVSIGLAQRGHLIYEVSLEAHIRLNEVMPLEKLL